MQKAMEEWRHPFASFNATTDLHASAIGAHSGKDGGVIITGPVSVHSALHKKQIQIGGYGFH